MNEKTYGMTMLLDFYGELLTDKQKRYLEQYYDEDLSLSEIAENEGITRQGVRDIIIRAQSALEKTEEKTGLLTRFNEMGEIIARMEEVVSRLIPLARGEAAEIAKELEGILGELRDKR